MDNYELVNTNIYIAISHFLYNVTYLKISFPSVLHPFFFFYSIW